MSASRRTILASAGAGLALTQISGPAHASERTDGGSVAELIRQFEVANAALMRGDIAGYRALIEITDDYTLMSPFGGTPTRGADMTSERWEAVGRFFRNGTFQQDVIQSYATADMIVLATIERTRVEVGGLPAQDWALRVTLVYRREGTEWRLAHRHADPLANGVSVERAAALARGKAP
jgi:ketosteroid isomerase-like protein